MPKADFETARKAMIDSQLRTSGVNEPWIMAAIGSLAREDFVPADRAPICYMDRGVPLDGGRMLNPAVATGQMLVEADADAADSVLLIGAATGYVATLLAQRCKSVTALEEDSALAKAAGTALDSFENAAVVTGPLAAGYAAAAPYSLVWIDGAIETLPAAIIDQIVEGGRIVSGLKDGPVTRLAIGFKRGGEVALRSFSDSEIAPLSGFAKTKEFAF
jgi:protein-L-isoaspartate(D-aspartate) O-methyltransferase